MTSKREHMLLVGFACALFVAASIFAWTQLSHYQAKQKAILKQREAALEEARGWLDRADYWKARGRWLDGNRPPDYLGPETDAKFVQVVQSSLGRLGIEILEQKIRETKAEGRLMAVSVDLVLKGSLEQFVQWLYETQQVDSFRLIRRIRLKSDAEESTMRAEISLIQLYQMPKAST